MNEQIQPATGRKPGRALLWLGILVALSGFALYFVLVFGLKVLVAPWYSPILATVGVGFVLLAIVRARSAWRWIALVFLTLFAASQWFGMLYEFATPAYTGPVKSGQPFPVFATTLADGTAFTQFDLQGDQNTVMVFYRGYW